MRDYKIEEKNQKINVIKKTLDQIFNYCEQYFLIASIKCS